jgi:hypothetical protein
MEIEIKIYVSLFNIVSNLNYYLINKFIIFILKI